MMEVEICVLLYLFLASDAPIPWCTSNSGVAAGDCFLGEPPSDVQQMRYAGANQTDHMCFK